LKRAAKAPPKRLLHHHAVVIGSDYPFEFRELARLGAKIKRRNVDGRVLATKA
jgi:hypothetical protein